MSLSAGLTLASFGALLAAFFSGAETGAYVLNRLRLHYRARELDDPRARTLEKILEDMPGFVTSMLIWTNLALDIVSIACTDLYGQFIPSVQPELLATLTASPLLFVFAELAPKTLFRLRAEGMMLSSASALRAAVWLAGPLAKFLSGLGLAMRRALRLSGPSHWSFISRRAIETAIASGAISPSQRHLLQGVLKRGRLGVARASIRLEDCPLLPADTTCAELLARAGELSSPRVLVYRGTRDQIVGVIHIAQAWGAPPERRISELAEPVLWLSEDATIVQALAAMKRSGRSVGLLVAPEQLPSGAGTDPASATQAMSWHAKAVITAEHLLKHLVATSA